MRLVYTGFPEAIKISSPGQLILTLESPNLYRQFLLALHQQALGEEDEVACYPILGSRKECQLETIFHPLLLDVNEKKILKKLERMLLSYVTEDYQAFIGLQQHLQEYLYDIAEALPVGVSWSTEMNQKKLLQLFCFNILTAGENSLERLLSYLEVITELNLAEVFLIDQLSAYFEAQDITAVIQYAQQKELTLILIERQEIKGGEEASKYILSVKLCSVRLEK